MAIKLAIIVALCIVTVHGQTKYCCYPETWESTNKMNLGQVPYGTKKLVFTEGTEMLSVDGANHRIASTSKYISGGGSLNVRILQLFDKKVMYVIQNGVCTNTTLPEWSRLCVPDSATPVKQTFYGMDKTKVDVDVFSVVVGPTTVYLTMASADCTFVYQGSYGSTTSVSTMTLKTFTNTTPGIKDPSVFDIPSSCTNATHDPQISVPKYGLF